MFFVCFKTNKIFIIKKNHKMNNTQHYNLDSNNTLISGINRQNVILDLDETLISGKACDD